MLTLNAVRRFPGTGPLTPYLGASAGITIPRVLVTTSDGGRTSEYQFGGPAIGGMAGASLRLAGRWSLFAKYRINYVWLDVDLDAGGSLRTESIVNAINFGVSLDF